jgi:asparagine synthase (glutamine-hydrolysing)
MAYALINKLMPDKYPLKTATLEDWLRYIAYFDKRRHQSLWHKDYQDTLQNSDTLHQKYWDQASHFGHFQKAQASDFNTYLPYDILTKVDIASMMHSLEVRTPLLDINVIELAAQIPEQFNISKVNGSWVGKKLLKQVVRKHFPEDFVYRRKMGFAMPVSRWFSASGQSRKQITERLLSSGNGLDTFFQPEALEQISNGNHAGQQWLMLFLQEWLSQEHSKP